MNYFFSAKLHYFSIIQNGELSWYYEDQELNVLTYLLRIRAGRSWIRVLEEEGDDAVNIDIIDGRPQVINLSGDMGRMRMTIGH